MDVATYRGDPRVVAKRLASQADALAGQLQQLTVENARLKRRLEATRYCYTMTNLMLGSLKQATSGAGTPKCPEMLQALEEATLLLQQLPGALPPERAQDIPKELPPTTCLTDADVEALGNSALHFNLLPLPSLACVLPNLQLEQGPAACHPTAVLKRCRALLNDVQELLLPRVFADTPEQVAAAEAALLRRMQADAPLDLLCLLQAPVVLMQLGCFNMVTGVPEEPTQEQLQEQLARLQLLPWQVDQICDLVVHLQTLAGPLMQRRRHLQQQLASREGSLGLPKGTPGDTPGDAGDPAAAAGRGAEAGAGDGGARGSMAGVQQEHGQQGQGHDEVDDGPELPPTDLQLTQQLDLLLRKAAWLEYCYSHLVCCTLTVTQMAYMVVYAHPYPPRPSQWSAVLYDMHRGASNPPQPQPCPQQQQQKAGGSKGRGGNSGAQASKPRGSKASRSGSCAGAAALPPAAGSGCLGSSSSREAPVVDLVADGSNRCGGGLATVPYGSSPPASTGSGSGVSGGGLPTGGSPASRPCGFTTEQGALRSPLETQGSSAGVPHAAGVSFEELLQVLGDDLEEAHLPLLMQLSGVVTDPGTSAALEQLLRASSGSGSGQLQ